MYQHFVPITSPTLIFVNRRYAAYNFCNRASADFTAPLIGIALCRIKGHDRAVLAKRLSRLAASRRICGTGSCKALSLSRGLLANGESPDPDASRASDLLQCLVLNWCVRQSDGPAPLEQVGAQVGALDVAQRGDASILVCFSQLAVRPPRAKLELERVQRTRAALGRALPPAPPR